MTSKLKILNDSEVWTDAFVDRFGERVCVGIEYPYIIRNGKKFKPTKKEVESLFEDYLTQEFGSKSQREKDFKEEFDNYLKCTTCKKKL